MWTYVATVESDSEPGKSYEMRRAGTGRLGCNCKRYQFARGNKTCKHLEAYQYGEHHAVIQASKAAEALHEARSTRERVRVVMPSETFTVTRRAISFGPIAR